MGLLTPNSELSNVVITTVKPARETSHIPSLYPTFFDITLVDGFIPIIFAYRLENTELAFRQFVDKIKSSLAEALVEFFPFAGRWIKTFDTKIRQLVCDDSGVPFIEAFLDEELDNVVKLDDFQPVKCLTGYDLMGLDYSKFNQSCFDEYRSLFIQVTRFRCGGVTMVVTFNHMTVDSNSFFQFTKAWAEISLKGHTDIKPNHDRSLAKSLEALIPGFLDEQPTKSLDGQDFGEGLKFPNSVTLVWKTLHVRKEAVEEMKKKVKQCGGDGPDVTTVDCITSHFWHSVDKLPSDAPRTMHTIVDGRRRYFEVPLPEHYCGNVVMGISFPPVPAQETPPARAKVVRASVLAVNHSTWKPLAMKCMQEYISGKGFTISSWIRFPMYETDFGSGKPFFASCMPRFTGVPLGFCNVLPPVPGRPQSAATAYIAVAQDAPHTFLEDPEFLSFFL